jgi:cell division protease FtsH
LGKVWKNAGLYILIVLVALSFISSFYTRQPADEDKSYSQFLSQVEQGEIKKVLIKGNTLVGETAGQKFKVVTPDDPNMVSNLRAHGVDIRVQDQEQSAWWVSVLSSVLLPVIFIVAVWVFLIRQAQSGSNQAMSFGKSRAKLMVENKPKVTFDDVAGVDEAKQELQEVVEFLKTPEKFQALGAKIPKGVLLVGAPGTGKTLLAKAVAGEAGVPFFSISGSDFVEMFVGVGASRVRDLFEQAKKHSPCIIFVDEIDAVGRQRGAGLGGGHDEREQTLNQLLVEMDGFEEKHSTIVIAATNRPDILDSALLRPGRFDRQVIVDRPDKTGREQILKVHFKDKPMATDIELSDLAKRTPGFTGADLANLANESALIAARHSRKEITKVDIEAAIDRVIAGPEKKSRIITDKEKEIIAYHEIGHTMVGMLLPNCDPVHKVTVVSRGMALGLTINLPEDRVLTSKAQLLDQVAMTMGGRAAEELFFGKENITTGAKNDIERATDMARKMVTDFGMSEKLGPMTFGRRQEHVFLGREMGEDRNFSETVASAIDAEVRLIIDEAYEKAKTLLESNRGKVVYISRVLMEKETLDNEQLRALLDGEIPQQEPVAVAT